MSERGQALFDQYVGNELRHSEAAFIGVTSHIFRLREFAAEQGVPIEEVVEEVGPLVDAIREAKAALRYC